MLRANTYHTSLLVSLGAVACMYAAAQHLHVSGPIATVVAGLLSGNITGPRLSEGTTAPLRTFWSGLHDTLNALLFVFVGLHVVLINPLAGVMPGPPPSRSQLCSSPARSRFRLSSAVSMLCASSTPTAWV
jgi:CPA1 family monovalent cation:H+ antiporter